MSWWTAPSPLPNIPIHSIPFADAPSGASAPFFVQCCLKQSFFEICYSNTGKTVLECSAEFYGRPEKGQRVNILPPELSPGLPLKARRAHTGAEHMEHSGLFFGAAYYIDGVSPEQIREDLAAMQGAGPLFPGGAGQGSGTVHRGGTSASDRRAVSACTGLAGKLL